MIIMPPSTAGLEFLGKGIECRVYEWSPGYVLKTFECEEEADDAYTLQREANLNGENCAPAVDDGFGVQLVWRAPMPGNRWGDRGAYVYAYVSEWVDMKHGADVCCFTDTMDEEVEELMQRLHYAGVSTCDMHSNNMGRNAEGILVRIDFGGAST